MVDLKGKEGRKKERRLVIMDSCGEWGQKALTLLG